MLAGALFLLSSLTQVSVQRSTVFGQIWGAADADAGKRRQKRDSDDWEPPKVRLPVKPNTQPATRTDKKSKEEVKADDDDDDTAGAKKGERTRPASAGADADDTPDVPSTLQGVLSRWLAPTKPIVTTTPTPAVPTTKVTTGATNRAQDMTGQGKPTGQSLSQTIKASTAQAWSEKTTIAPAAGNTNPILQNKNTDNSKTTKRRTREEERERERLQAAAEAATRAAAEATAKAAAAAAASAKSADGAGKDAPRRPLAGDLGLRVPLVNQAHILARNLSAQALKNATDLGLKVKNSRSFDVIGTTVTQLVVPPHLDIVQARAALQQAAPDSTISFNQQYRLYPQAKGESSQVSHEPAKSTGGCTPDRCYGAQTIGWHGEHGVCARDLKIGVIDTGIDGSHPALSHDPGRISYGVIGPEKRAPGNDLHGTGVLALLAGDPKSSTPGLVPRAKFFVADIFFADEKGLPVSTTMHLLEALDWMERMQVQIINLSLSGPSDDLVKTAIAKMSQTRRVDGVTRPGVVFIAAAGNGGPGAPPSYPAAYSEVVAVTAISKDLRGYRRANQGDYIDIAAPGVDIWTALPNGRQGFQTGTSFATPYVTAVVASVYRTLPRTRTKTAVLQHLPVRDLGIPGPDRVYGRGLLNAPASCDPSKTPVANRRVPSVLTTKVSAN